MLLVNFSSTVPPPGQQACFSASMSLPVPSVSGDGAHELLELLVLGDEVGLAELTSTIAPLCRRR
jgi:hypothetical protein